MEGDTNMLEFWKKFALVWAIVGALALPATSAMADEVEGEGVAGSEAAVATEAPTAEPERRPYGLEEITVSARKKGGVERLQEVPIAVSAFTGNYLEMNFVEDLYSLGRSAPNVQLSDQTSFQQSANFSIRGNAIFGTIVSDEPQVGIFVDGIYSGMNVAAVPDLFELEMVEILRGPQGTLFGRNVTGGAINARTRRPSGEFHVRGRATIGSFSRSDGALSVEAPINETLAWKLDLNAKDRNGSWDTPNLGGETGKRKSWLLRPMFSWQPTEDIDVQFLYESQRHTGDGAPISRMRERSPFGFPSAGEVGKFDLQDDSRGSAVLEAQRATAEVNWDVGPGTLTSITGWRNIKVTTLLGDVDSIPLNLVQQEPSPNTTLGYEPSVTYQWQISSELRYNTQIGERLDVTTGLYYFKQDIDYRENRRFFAGPGPGTFPPNCPGPLFFGEVGEPPASCPLGGLFGGGKGELDHQSAAWFLQGDYQLTEKLTLTLGTRWTWEEKVAVVFPFSLGNSLCNATFTECVGDERRRDDQDTWDYWSRHAGLRYQINDDLMVYGSYTRSFRAGGYNLRADIRSPFSPYDEERIDAYELGFKADWLDNTLRTNLSAFYNRGDDIQRTIFVEFIQDQLNAAKAHVAGVEAEVTWLPIEGLTLNSTVGWVDAEYDSYAGVCNGTQATGPCSKVFGVPLSEISSGVGRELDFAYIPEWTWSAMGRYEFPFPVLLDGTLAVQASVYWRDDTFGDERNEVPVDSYTHWDASISYRAPDDRYSISFFGKNLTERPYTNFAVASLGTIIDISPAEQRTWGVEVSFDY